MGILGHILIQDPGDIRVRRDETLGLSDLRALVGRLIGVVQRLSPENRALRDEIARLKGLPPRP